MSAWQKQPRLDDYPGHIEEAALLACSYVSGMDKATFLQDKRTQQAGIYNSMIIGAAATQIIIYRVASGRPLA